MGNLKISGPKYMETQNGNLLICFPLMENQKTRTFYFFADKKGIPLNGATVTIWSEALVKWGKPVLPLPKDLLEKVRIIASKLNSLAEGKCLKAAPELVFGKETEPEKVINKSHSNNQLAEKLKKVLP